MTSHTEYRKIHKWLRDKYGAASKCESTNCNGRTHRYNWALRADKQYARRRNNFFQLCTGCHIKYDRQHQNYHKFDAETVAIRIYKDTHKLLQNHADKHHLSISGLVHSFAKTLV